MDQVISLAKQNAWLAITVVVIGIVVRALKDDGPIPINLPAKFRPWLAAGLGILSGVLDAVSRGTAWRDALIGGAVASLAAMGGHDLVVESVRGGREFGESKEKFTKRSVPPPAPVKTE